MIKKLKKIYSNGMLKPGFLGIFINPFYIIGGGIYKGISSNVSYLHGKFLDFGCGIKPYQHLIKVDDYIGLDIEESGHDHEHEHIDVYYDGKKIPFEDNTFDSVMAAEVFEHVFNLEEIIIEINRVMKKNAHILITVPFVRDEHEIPYDFGRYTSFGIRHILEKAGFEIINITKSTNYVETVIQMWNAYIYQRIFPKNYYLKMILTPIFISPMTIIGIILGKILPENKNFYHNNIVIAKKLT